VGKRRDGGAAETNCANGEDQKSENLREETFHKNITDLRREEHFSYSRNRRGLAAVGRTDTFEPGEDLAGLQSCQIPQNRRKRESSFPLLLWSYWDGAIAGGLRNVGLSLKAQGQSEGSLRVLHCARGECCQTHAAKVSNECGGLADKSGFATFVTVWRHAAPCQMFVGARPNIPKKAANKSSSTGKPSG
jgi:hypothetical protein